MPKRSRSGVVSRPARVVAPISVKRGRSSVITFAPGPDAERDRQLAVLHRGVERLLDRAREPVDLVDEEDRARLEVGEEGRDVALALERRAGGLARTGRRAPRPRSARGSSCPARAGRRAARGRARRRARRRRRSRRRAAPCSSSWPTNSSSRRGRSVASSSSSARSCGVCRRSMPGVRMLTGAPPSARGRSGPRASRRGAPSSSSLGLLGREAEADEAVAGEQPRVVAARDHDRVVGGRGADLLAQLDDDPLGGALADPGHGLQPRRVAGRDGGEQLARRAAATARRARPSGRRTGRRSAAGTGRARPRRRSRRAAARRRGRSGGCAASPACRRRACGAASRPRRRAGSRRRRRRRRRGRCAARRPRRQERDHAAAPVATAARSGAPLAWQMATASASAAWSGRGSSVERQQRLDHPLDLALVRAARAADRALDLLRRVGEARQPALAGGEDDDAARLADRERRARVRAEVQVLDRERVGLVLVEQRAHARVDRGEPRAGSAPRRRSRSRRRRARRAARRGGPPRRSRCWRCRDRCRGRPFGRILRGRPGRLPYRARRCA